MVLVKVQFYMIHFFTVFNDFVFDFEFVPFFGLLQKYTLSKDVATNNIANLLFASYNFIHIFSE